MHNITPVVVEMSLTTERQQELNDIAIKNFREYLQIPSVHPDVNYGELPKMI